MVKQHSHPDLYLRGRMETLARQMRREFAPAEDLLWQRLRNRQVCGRKFRRQYSIDRFIVDFFCPEAALIIEVDGAVHDQKSEPDRDGEEILKALGFHILRFTNAQVLHHMDQAIK